jgi:hypothetical protein
MIDTLQNMIRVINNIWLMTFYTFISSWIIVHLGDNSVVSEDFTASIGDLMVTNWVFWRRDNGASKRIFATIKSKIGAVKFSNTTQLSPF